MPEPTTFLVEPLVDAPLGARVTLPKGVTDPSLLDEKDFQSLLTALKTYQVLVIPGQKDLPPNSQVALTKRIDPTCGEGVYGHSKEFRHEKSVLRRDGHSVPSAPQVQILGSGTRYDHEGLDMIELRHPTHLDFHKEILSQEDMDNGFTRYYRWHIDSALYGLSPPVATTLLGIDCDQKDQQIIRYDDGTNDEKKSSLAATAFISGQTAFELLSPEDKEFALNTTVVYAPHPYIFISPAKAHSTGLVMVSEGKEMPLDQLPAWEESKIKRLPMVWTNPITGKHHLQIHGACVYKLETRQGKIYELQEARDIVYRLMRPAISPKHVYTHDWDDGDLVIFHNQGVWHSVTGQFDKDGRRLMHQCNIASGMDPVCKA